MLDKLTHCKALKIMAAQKFCLAYKHTLIDKKHAVFCSLF